MPDGATLIRPTGYFVGRIRRLRRHPAICPGRCACRAYKPSQAG
ncbi:hypothetical protein HMPREF3220_00549 [Citrobacter koseri]|nr:hypothetical protein HMPREF3207_01849 [Citrobacter koseri]KXA03746.1 hypothetical protein HMPREF3220_00549 [Citrobacter koseri]